jgi:type IV pilus assembly protein PilN
VILINLLPHREAKRLLRRRAFLIGLGFAALIGLLLAGIWYSVMQQMAGQQRSRNEFLSSEISRLDSQIKDIATLRTDIDALQARQKAVEDLQTDRNLPVYLLNELVRQTPEGVYLTTIRQAGEQVTLNGIAQTNERVSEYLRNTLYNSTWLERPELIEIKSISMQGPNREQRRLFEFAMRVTLKRPQAAAPAASAPTPAAAAAKSSS